MSMVYYNYKVKKEIKKIKRMMKIMETIILATVNGYDLSVFKNVVGTVEMYVVNVKQNKDSSVEIRENAVLGVNNLEDIKFSISVPSKNLKIAEIDKHVNELKNAELAIAEFNKHIQLSI